YRTFFQSIIMGLLYPLDRMKTVYTDLAQQSVLSTAAPRLSLLKIFQSACRDSYNEIKSGHLPKGLLARMTAVSLSLTVSMMLIELLGRWTKEYKDRTA